jgi:hypothetical protein
MRSQAQIAASARNAKKSTGPRTIMGKARSRLNSLKHGTSARIALLPDEDPTAFKNRMVSWVNALRPRNGIELFLAERAVYFSWQLDRAQRAQSARLCLKAHAAAEDEENRVEQEVAEFTQRLFRNPRGPLSAHAPAERQRGRPRDFRPDAVDDTDNPSLLVARLESSRAGCCGLIERWIDLGAILAKGLPWLASDRFMAIRLLRMHAIESIGTPKLTALLRACQVLDPQAGDLVNEMWEDLVPARVARSLEQVHAGRADQFHPPDAGAARQQLLEIVNREIERLEAKVQRHEHRAAFEASLSTHRLAFDDSPDAELLRRHELSCNENLFRILDALQNRHNEKGKRFAPVYTGYESIQPVRFNPPAAVIDSPGMSERSERTDTCATVDRADTMAPTEPGPTSGYKPTNGNECRLQDGPVAAGGLDSQSVEASSFTPLQQQKVMAVARQILQDEAMSGILAGPHHEGRGANVASSPVREHRATKRAAIARKTNAQSNPVGLRGMNPLSRDVLESSAER